MYILYKFLYGITDVDLGTVTVTDPRIEIECHLPSDHFLVLGILPRPGPGPGRDLRRLGLGYPRL